MIPASHFCLSQRRKGTKAGYAGVCFFWFVVLDWEARGLGLPASLLYAVTGPGLRLSQRLGAHKGLAGGDC